MQFSRMIFPWLALAAKLYCSTIIFTNKVKDVIEAHCYVYFNLEWSYLAWHSRNFSLTFSLNFGRFSPWTFVSNNINARYMSINIRDVGDVMITS